MQTDIREVSEICTMMMIHVNKLAFLLELPSLQEIISTLSCHNLKSGISVQVVLNKNRYLNKTKNTISSYIKVILMYNFI